MHDLSRNASGCADPTAYLALGRVERQSRHQGKAAAGSKPAPAKAQQRGGASPCPFCLNDRPYCDEVYGLRSGENGGEDPYAVHCMQCGARGPVEKTREQAIMAWNGYR